MIGERYYYVSAPGQYAVWEFGLLYAWRALDERGGFRQGITLTYWGAKFRARRWVKRKHRFRRQT